MNRLKNLLTNNLALKIISVVIALMIWLVVVNVDDPIDSQTYRAIPVQVKNSGYIESMNKTYRIEDEDSTVSVILKGKRSVIKNRQNDITAAADLTQIIDLDSDPVMVPVTVTCPGVEAEDITVIPGNIPVIIEDAASIDPMVSVNTSNIKPANGYEVGEISVNPENIVITGPKTIIQQIDRVVAEVEVNGISQDTTVQAKLKIVDENKEELSEAKMSYLKFSSGSANVNVDIRLWEVRDGVKLKADYKGSVPSGYQVSETTTAPEEISVAGSPEALEALAENGNEIIIPSGDLERNDEFEWTLDLSQYLPEGLKLATDVTNRIQVKAVIIPLGSRSLNLEVTSITVQNQDIDLDVAYDEKQVIVSVKAASDILDKLTVGDISATIDLKDLGAGDYTVPVSVTLPDGYELVEPVELSLHLMEKEKTGES